VANRDDSPWRRPPAGSPAGGPTYGDASRPGEPGAPTSPQAPAPTPFTAYSGPPPSNPPPAGWRPPIVATPPDPGRLPAQDHDRIDVEEQAARTLTQGIGLVVGAILLVLMLFLCARAIF
jgi:hypothetical protein